MTARFQIKGKGYIAVDAIPYVTGGFFTLGNVADMIANYESFCDVGRDGREPSSPRFSFQRRQC